MIRKADVLLELEQIGVQVPDWGDIRPAQRQRLGPLMRSPTAPSDQASTIALFIRNEKSGPPSCRAKIRSSQFGHAVLHESLQLKFLFKRG